MSRSPETKLSGRYDDLEHRLTQFLGIKVLLIRGWNGPRICAYTREEDGTETFGSEDPATQSLTREFMNWTRRRIAYEHREGPHPGRNPDREAAKDSLCEYLYERDPALGMAVRDEELESLLDRRHVTLRNGNCTPAKAVIVFDAADEINNDDALKRRIFGRKFQNFWARSGDRENRKIPYSNFIENLSITTSQYRLWQALSHIHYALSNQLEHDSFDKGSRGFPFYYSFAGLNTQGQGISGGLSHLTMDDARKRLHFEETMASSAQSLGLPDDDWSFFDQMTQAGAVMDLVKDHVPPIETFARLANSNSCWAKTPFRETRYRDVENCRKTLQQQIKDALVNAGLRYGESDLRLLIPAFRYVYETEKYDPAGQAYLDTVWKGCETFFPSLAAAPMPKAGDAEPPRSATGYYGQAELGLPAPALLPA